MAFLENSYKTIIVSIANIFVIIWQEAKSRKDLLHKLIEIITFEKMI